MQDVSPLALFGRLTVSLLVVVALMAFAGRLLRRRGFGGAGTAQPLDVVARRSLGRSSAVTVVRTAGRLLVLGVTDNNITLLGELDADAWQQPSDSETERTRPPGRPGAPRPTWSGLLDMLRERTVRRS